MSVSQLIAAIDREMERLKQARSSLAGIETRSRSRGTTRQSRRGGGKRKLGAEAKGADQGGSKEKMGGTEERGQAVIGGGLTATSQSDKEMHPPESSLPFLSSESWEWGYWSYCRNR